MIQKELSWLGSSLGLVIIALLLVELTVIGTVVAQRRVTKVRNADRAGELFRNNCARCHGLDGRGKTPTGELYKSPDFTDRDWWRTHSDLTSTRNLVAIVTRGRGGMPAFGKKLKRREIITLVNYVRRFRQVK